jgi:hypothetical protein
MYLWWSFWLILVRLREWAMKKRLTSVGRVLFWTAAVAASLLAWLPLGNPAWCATGSLMPADKLNHAFAFVTLYVLLWWAYRLAACRAALLLCGFGLVLETFQILLPYRTFSPLDVVANLVGIGVGMAAIKVLGVRC